MGAARCVPIDGKQPVRASVMASVAGVSSPANFTWTHRGSGQRRPTRLRKQSGGSGEPDRRRDEDWEHWGSQPELKAGVTGTGYTAVGTGTILSYANDPLVGESADGQPTPVLPTQP